jgi:carbamoyltransferase
MCWILGINAYHADSAACLVYEGKLIAAAEEERFNRLKHWAGFPLEAIRFCLKEGGVSLKDIAYVAINRKPWANLWPKLLFTLMARPESALVGKRLNNAQDWLFIKKKFGSAFEDEKFKGKIKFIEHHQAHLASSFLVSPMDKAAILSVDGFGDFSSTAWGIGHNNELKIMGRTLFPHSLGLFYMAITQFLGFLNYGDDYKVMGLAAYGNPTYEKEMAELVRLLPQGQFQLNLPYFKHHTQNVKYEWNNTIPQIGKIYSKKLWNLLGPERQPGDQITGYHQDIAHSLQFTYERVLFHILNYLYSVTRSENLCMAGGCAMNSVANGKIRENTSFKNLYIQSAPGDAGGAIGAAMALWHGVKNQPRQFVMDHAAWGPNYSTETIKTVIENRAADLEREGCSWERLDQEEILFNRVAELISEGKVVGFFQGRMEWGPRALGNRSILCDPRRSDMKDILNLKIKRRESFRPFAPSILREAVPDYFEQDDDVPFMLQVFKIKPEKRALIPAVTHVDGSGRLQTVSATENPRYYRLIKKYQEVTGIPIVLNTSFNENEPVVNRPEEALDCFIRTKMDVLVLENYFISRNSS